MESKPVLSSNSSESIKSDPVVNSSENIKSHPVVIREELHSIIGSVKKMQLVTTYEEVIEGLKIYIWENKLYDPYNPFKVHCKDDVLGSVFGTKEFTVFDVKTILQKFVIPISKISKDSPEATSKSVCEISVKRKFDENKESYQKKKRNEDGRSNPTSPLILHIPPSPNEHESSDSPDSVQGYETAYAKDTSDNFSNSDEFFPNEEDIIPIEETFDVEYEVDSDFSDEDTFSSVSSDSVSEADEVDVDAAILSLVCRTDSDVEFFADNSSEEDDEIPESDHWKCLKCNFFNRPTMGNCSKCWKERLAWLPEKSKSKVLSPPRRRRKQRKFRGSTTYRTSECQQQSEEENSERKKDNSEVLQVAESLTISSSQEINDEASFSKSSQDSQENSCPEVSLKIKENSSVSLSNACLVDAFQSGGKLCIICCEKPINASIIHGKYAHQFSCYKCAKKLQKQQKRCPICRRSIERVVLQLK